MLSNLVSAVTASVNGETDAPETTTDVTKTEGEGTPVAFSSESPEATIHAILDEHGGRIFQQDIVANTEYSAATVSRLLSEMEADDQITRYWKNQRKVVAYPDLGPNSVN